MTKPLPQRDVEARPTRSGRPRLNAIEKRALESIDNPDLKKVLAELLISARGSQENFQQIEQWFPIQPPDVAKALRPPYFHIFPDHTVYGRSFEGAQESKGGEEGTKGKWRKVNEFRYSNERGVMGIGIVPVLMVDGAGATAFIEMRIANFTLEKSVLVAVSGIAGATQLIPGLRMEYPVAVSAGTQGDQFFNGILAPEMWEVDLEAWPDGEPCQLEVRAANANTIIPGDYPKAFTVTTYV